LKFGLFRVIPEAGRMGEIFFFGNQFKLMVNVKGTSSALQVALKDL
jgi:hypothetical protein